MHASNAGSEARLLVRWENADPVPPGWEERPVALEEPTMAYLREQGAGSLPGPQHGLDETSEVTR